jgi:hypothetical protein
LRFDHPQLCPLSGLYLIDWFDFASLLVADPQGVADGLVIFDIGVTISSPAVQTTSTRQGSPTSQALLISLVRGLPGA